MKLDAKSTVCCVDHGGGGLGVGGDDAGSEKLVKKIMILYYNRVIPCQITQKK